MKKSSILVLTIILLVFIDSKIISQNFLNGSFEINTSSACNYNLGNATFTAAMSNCDAYGGAQELDIMGPGASCPYGIPECGNWFVALACPGGITDAFTMTLSAPLVAGTNYTMSFWDEADPTYPPGMPVVIGISTTSGGPGTVVYTGPIPTASVWSQRTFTFAAPNNGMYVSVSTAGPTRWSHVDDFVLNSTSPCTTNSITTGTIVGSPFCACSVVNVPFTSTGVFNAGNIYTAELSDASGSFAAPVSIGTLASTLNAGTIACTIPCTTLAGAFYRFRVTSSNPVVVGSDNGVDIIINVNSAPTVSITAVPVGTICSGASVTFTANPVSGGTLPTYQWQLNGVNIAGATSATYTTTTLVNGDNISVTLTSNDPCASPLTATNSVVVSVNPPVVPSVNITALPAGSICVGTSVTFTAIPINGGTIPTYQWQINGVNVVGATSATFSSATLVNGDAVSVILTSNEPCAVPAVISSNIIAMIVNAIPIVTVNSPIICAGMATTLTANGATTYTWSAGATSTGVNTATANPLITTSYTVTGTTAGCVSTAIATVTTGAGITVTATGATICEGAMAIITASGGNSYVWSSGATPIGIDSAIVSPSSTSTYTVTGTASGCTGTATATVTVVSMPEAIFTAPLQTSLISPEVHFVNHSTNAATYNWNFGDLINLSSNMSTLVSPSHFYSQVGEYCVQLIATNIMCTDTTLQCIEIIPEFTFYIPTAFSPNEDGTNDLFLGTGENIKEYKMRIFNRWGEQLFFSDNILNAWNGKLHGNYVKEDVYVYVFNIIDYTGKEHKYIGNVTLIK